MSGNNCKDFSIRPLVRNDVPFMENMAYLASYSINGRMMSFAPPFDEYRAGVGRAYTENWGRTGDYGVVAVDVLQNKIGAAWFRDYGDSKFPSPRIEIAVEPAHQVRKGVGTGMMERLLSDATQQGLEAMHLTVDEENDRAKSLYKKIGFVTIGEYFNLEIMRICLNAISPSGASET